MRHTATAVLITAFLALSPGGPIRAQQAPPPLDLEAAIQEALDNNPGLNALDHRARAAKREATGAALTRLGQLEGVAWASRYRDAQIARPIARELLAGGFSGLPFDRDQFHYGLTYRVPLYLGGKLTGRIRVARFEAQKAEALRDGARWQVRYNVAALYAGVQTLEGIDRAVGEEIAALEKTEQRLDLMIKQGKRPELDLLKVQEQLAETRAQQADVQAETARARALLLALLGRDPSGPLALELMDARMPALSAPPQALREAVQKTSEVQQARLAASQARAGVAIARGEFLPSIFARANLIENDGPDIHGPLRTWEATVSVSLPLFAGGERFARLSGVKEKQKAADEAAEQIRLQQAARLEEALARFHAAKLQVQAAESQVAAAAEAARIEQIRYDTGADTIEDLLRARARQQAAQAAQARAQGDVCVTAQKINILVEKEVVK